MTAERLKIHPRPAMLADDAQLVRWRRLLASAIGSAALRPIAATNGYRSEVIQCLLAARKRSIVGIAGSARVPKLPAPAADGPVAAMAIWARYAEFCRGNSEAERRLVTAIYQLYPTALVATDNDNLEPWWQQEMIILHALHSFALKKGETDLIEMTLGDTAFHLAEIQPDHATSEPWAIHAYASHIDGNVTAETLLHAAYLNGGGVLSETSRWILADAMTALESVTSDE